MSCNRPSIFVLLTALCAAAAFADPPIHTEAMKPIAFAAAGDKVWSAVVLASTAKKGTQPAAVPAELAPYAAKLSKFFGCDQFEILGSATKAIDGQVERWLVPTQNFWVGARATRERTGYRLNMEFFHDKRLLLETEAKLAPRSPLFIRGPMHARGQIILVFEIKP